MTLRTLPAQCLTALGLLSLVSTLAASPAPANEPDIRRDATVLAVEEVMPSVVNIATETLVKVRDPFEDVFRDFWGPYHRSQPPNSQYSLGSGVVIDEAGYVLTNDHVVQRADKIAVKFCTGTNVYEATIVAADPKSDVALLKLEAAPGEKFRAIKFAREDDLLLGETVLALGNPFGLGGSVTRGILSSKSRIAPKEGERLDIPNWLQTDAPINFGNSGGPLVNLRGELIGINVAVLSGMGGQPAQGIGFAIPIRRVGEALSEIFPAECVKSYWFGARVKVGTSPPLITSVQPQSPAGKAGLKPGDTILQVGGKSPRSFLDFNDLLAGYATSEVKLVVQRAGGRRELALHLLPEKEVFNAELVRDKLGLSLEPLTQELAQRFGIYNVGGFVITAVQENSPAARAGLGQGFVVTAIDGQLPSDLTSAAKVVYTKQKGEPVQLEIAARQRMGNFFFLRQGTVEVAVR